MNEQDIKDIDPTLDESAMIDKEVNIPEAPAVANVKVWIKGYGVLFTVRGEKLNDMIMKTTRIIDYAESHGWKNTWDTTSVNPASTATVATTQLGECPKCGASLVEGKTKDGLEYIKCSTNKWDKIHKKAIGCDYIDWKNKD